MLLIMIQVVLGIVIKTLNMLDFSSNFINKLSLCHKIVGYVLTILAKINYYL